MSENSAESPPWGGFRWTAAVLLILMLHLGGLYALSDWAERPAGRGEDPFRVVLLTGAGDARRLLEAASLNDPTLLASVSPRGFSGPAWLNIAPPPFKLPEWTDEERWLTQDVAVLGADFRSYVRTNLGATLSIAKQTLPPPIAAAEVKEAPGVSRLIVAGDLARRPLIEQPELKPMPGGELLMPSEVEVLVDDKGYVFSPRLQPAYGVRSPAQQAADREALRLIPRLRFAPVERLPGDDDFPFAKGYVVFHWATAPPAATNAPPR